MIPAPVLSAGFMQFGISAFTMHDALFMPPVKAPLPGLIEGPAFMGWPPGMIAHKKAFTVFADGNMAIQQGHDVGYVIPHLAAPLNAFIPVNIAFSKHKVVMPASTVNVGGAPVGTYMFAFLGEICAQPVCLPTGVLILLKCTVWTDLTPLDMAKGMLTLAIDAGFDHLWNKYVKNLVPKAFKELKLPKWVGKASIAAMGGAIMIVREVSGRAVNKAIDHVAKTFISSPLVTSLPFGKVGLGRGNWGWSHKFFSW